MDKLYIYYVTDLVGYIISWEGIKPDPNKVQEIMDLVPPTTKSETWVLVGMVQYYRDMWPRRSHVLSHLIEKDIVPKGRKYSGMVS